MSKNKILIVTLLMMSLAGVCSAQSDSSAQKNLVSKTESKTEETTTITTITRSPSEDRAVRERNIAYLINGHVIEEPKKGSI